jgi:hypothetical protein
MAKKIMVIRHAEKHDDIGVIAGVTVEGRPDPEDLTVRGWQRAGALIALFLPPEGVFVDRNLANPDAIFASGIGPHSKSQRPQNTVAPLAAKLGLQLNTNHLKGEEVKLAADVLGRNGVVLIAWEHEAIPLIGNSILGNNTSCPQSWPENRFDLVWVFDQNGGSGGWNFNQVPQCLLAGDSNEPI